jgi:hypothetical protein
MAHSAHRACIPLTRRAFSQPHARSVCHLALHPGASVADELMPKLQHLTTTVGLNSSDAAGLLNFDLERDIKPRLDFFANECFMGGGLSWRIQFRGCRNPVDLDRIQPSPNRPNFRISLNAHTQVTHPPCGAQRITPNSAESDTSPNRPNFRNAYSGAGYRSSLVPL